MESILIFNVQARNFICLLEGVKPLLITSPLSPPSTTLTLYKKGGGGEWGLSLSCHSEWGWEVGVETDTKMALACGGGDNLCNSISYRLTPSVFLGLLRLLSPEEDDVPYRLMSIVSIGEIVGIVSEQSITGMGVERLFGEMNCLNSCLLDAAHPSANLMSGSGEELGSMEALGLERELSALSFYKGEKNVSLKEVKKIMNDHKGCAEGVFYPVKLLMEAIKASRGALLSLSLSLDKTLFIYHEESNIKTKHAIKALKP